MVSQILALVLSAAVVTCSGCASGFRAGGPDAGVAAEISIGPTATYPEPVYVPRAP
jgi:hypothetical protein